MAFEIYKSRFNKEETVAVSKNHLTLNKKLIEKLDAKFVELAYDPDTKAIRIKPSQNGFVLNNNKIGARGFFKQFGIDRKGKFTARFDQAENAIYVDIV